ncbi:MAG: hypothetical protein BGO90_13970 [Legionella sp. 40-6]|nr:hypothetical protein [Legionella sp.]OJY11801.1 MAG: hypothetical protein BGO90_13970 [Legionella sp. 40-6]
MVTHKNPGERRFYAHLLRNTALGILFTIIALCTGMVGYHLTEKMPWLDSFMNAAMILSGMGPATNIVTPAGKIFAGCYALFSDLAFIAVIVILLSPLIHQFFRKLHIENTRDNP